MAGLRDTAGEEGRGGEGMLPAGGRLFGPLARAQYNALLHLRWRLFINSLRSKSGAFEFGARTISYIVYALMGVGLAFGAGGIAYGLASDHQWDYMPAVFWFVLLTWQVVPIMIASFQEQFNLGAAMLRFPLAFRSFYLLYVVFGLSDVSTAIGAMCSLGILMGITAVRPDLFAFTVFALLIFSVFNILLVRAVFAWIDRWLSQRKTREILAAFFMVFFLSFQLMNPAVWQHDSHEPGPHHVRQPNVQQIFSSRWARGANQVQQWLPPGLAGRALSDASARREADGIGLLALLAFYAIAAGSILGLRLKAEYRGEDLSFAPAQKIAKSKPERIAARSTTQENVSQAIEAPLGSSSIIPAIMEKELRTLLRALPLLYAIGAPVLMVLVFSGAFVRRNAVDHTPVFAFPLCVFFAQLGFHQLWGNSFGTEGAGVQFYYLSPTSFRTVLLAKNLFHTILFALVMTIAGTLATVRLGVPNDVILCTTASWLLFVLPVNLAVGNIFSLTMPYKINPGRISRQRRSQGAALLSLLVQIGLVAVGALVYLFSSVMEMPLLSVPIFLVLGLVAALAWFKILANSDNLANQRKDQLIAVLTKADD